jgi:hypothetical protein
MLNISRIAFAMILIASLPALGADPTRVADPENFCAEILNAISSGKPNDAANLIATTIGRADSAGELMKFLKILEDKDFDFTKKVVDKDYNNALRQIVFYSYLKNLGFVYFRFNFKMTSTGWILSNFTFKDETNELFPRDFMER